MRRLTWQISAMELAYSHAPGFVVMSRVGHAERELGPLDHIFVRVDPVGPVFVFEAYETEAEREASRHSFSPVRPRKGAQER